MAEIVGCGFEDMTDAREADNDVVKRVEDDCRGRTSKQNSGRAKSANTVNVVV